MWESFFELPHFVTASMPTFIHTLAAAFLLHGICSSNREVLILAGIASFGFEFSQAVLPSLGVFDVTIWFPSQWPLLFIKRFTGLIVLKKILDCQ
ncbi:hypothetical protein [Pseudobacteriovorax antillogorgiicola]|uniref:hypothetical protein n=1 Tax=Pseudobacteriovorax antillogorgiicola TaxID=1513793 RepID=UPI001052AFDA|nr:hypothetical protein [Pseudobacteriovorax antillogorgiicola]